ncbi:MAG: leucine-rich repeat domain-containing protein, partial [Clostridia bacterium]|nr:leucine-rich repeat domain-containing protein [Clostridia bacterium]
SEVTLAEGTRVIGEEAFASLKSLQKLSLPESLEKIDAYAFWSSGTEDLEITVPQNVKTIGEDAFANSKAKITYLNGADAA